MTEEELNPYAIAMKAMLDADDKAKKESAGGIPVADLAGIVKSVTGKPLDYQHLVHVEIDGQEPIQLILDGGPHEYTALVIEPGSPQDADLRLMNLREFHERYHPDINPKEILTEGIIQGGQFTPEPLTRIVGRDTETLTRRYRDYAAKHLSNSSALTSRLGKRSRELKHL